MAKDPAEQRKFRRYDVDSVHGKMIYASDVNILNISMDGAAIATTQRLTIGREYSLKLKFDSNILALRGKVMWSVLSHSKTMPNGEVVPVYKAGVRFTNVLTNEATNLITYIEMNRTSALEKRILGVRFKVGQPDKASIHMDCDYDIKRISQSGMLLETDSVMPLDSQHEMEINLDGTPVSVVGRIANQAEIRDGEKVRYDIGIEFVSIGENDLRVLNSYLSVIEKNG